MLPPSSYPTLAMGCDWSQGHSTSARLARGTLSASLCLRRKRFNASLKKTLGRGRFEPSSLWGSRPIFGWSTFFPHNDKIEGAPAAQPALALHGQPLITPLGLATP